MVKLQRNATQRNATQRNNNKRKLILRPRSVFAIYKNNIVILLIHK
jgi:hypothetical protein